MFDLTGKTALVTGASGGLGGAIARALHGQGATVALSGTRREALEALAAELGERAHVLPCDLSDVGGGRGAGPRGRSGDGLARHPRQQRRRDARQSLHAHEGRRMGQVIAVNLTAAFRLSRAVLKGMMRRRHGRIIGITSVVGVTGNPGQGNYAAAKAGMIGMSKALAAEVASRGITVNCVAPGFIASPMTDALNEKQREAILAAVPMGRLGAGRRHRRGGRLSGERGGRLRHRPDAAREWRNGNDLRHCRILRSRARSDARPLALL